ncbi:hypothetical protein CDD83_4701 [Cordyceps sp. RAO-2017]|nr:hypothetical protein CDD83_4701 [Cordyceps sp. RAO-2017]
MMLSHETTDARSRDASRWPANDALHSRPPRLDDRPPCSKEIKAFLSSSLRPDGADSSAARRTARDAPHLAAPGARRRRRGTLAQPAVTSACTRTSPQPTSARAAAPSTTSHRSISPEASLATASTSMTAPWGTLKRPDPAERVAGVQQRL